MKLPPGATGFGPSGAQASLDDVHAFLTACHDAARRTCGTLIATRQPGVTPSFHTVVIRYEDQDVAVLRHARLDLIALAHDPGSGSMLTGPFIDHFPLTETLSQTATCQILSAADLNSPLSDADPSELSAAERKQIRYWKPATLGELLFNYWD